MAAPKLRFKEFDGDWIKSKLGSETQFFQGEQVSLDDQCSEYAHGLIKFLRIENFTQKSKDFRYIRYTGSQEKILVEQDIAIVRYGATAGFICSGETGVIANNLFKVSVDNKKINQKYLELVLKSEKTFNYFQAEMSGGAMPALNFKIVGNLDITYSSIQEQTKIASFLSAVDEKISQLTQKHQLLSQYKQGMMQKLFSQQIRFKADDGSEFGEWEENQIQYFMDKKYILDQMDGNHGELYPKSEEFSNEGIPYIGATDFSNGVVNFSNAKKVPLERALKFKKGIAKDGDVLFAHNATVGPVALLNTNLEFVILSTTATYYRCNSEKLVNTYLKNILESDYFKKQYVGIMSQSTRNQVPITTQRKLNLLVPCLEEQTKIANFLSAIDQKIAVVAQQIEQAKQWKKGLLQQMFV